MGWNESVQCRFSTQNLCKNFDTEKAVGGKGTRGDMVYPIHMLTPHVFATGLRPAAVKCVTSALERR